MEYEDHTGGPEIAQAVFKKVTKSIMEFGDIPPITVHTALVLIVDSFCHATNTPHEHFVKSLYTQKRRRGTEKS